MSTPRRRPARSGGVGVRRPRVAGRPTPGTDAPGLDADERIPTTEDTAGVEAAQSETGAESAADAGEARAKRGWLPTVPPIPLALMVVGVVLAAAATFFGIEYFSSSGNTAYADATTTQQVSTQVSSALNTLLAFDYKQPDKNTQAAKKLIDGSLGDCDNAGNGDAGKVGYDKLMDVLKQQGAAQKLTMSSSVQRIGVQQLQGDRAELLVLLVQSYTRGEGPQAQSSSALAAATVNAVLQDGTWKLKQLCLQ